LSIRSYKELKARGVSILRIEGLGIGIISGGVRSYKEWIELVIGVGAKFSKDRPLGGTGTIITSSSILGLLDTDIGRRFSKSISNGSIRGIIRSIFSISIPDYPNCYIIILLLETSLYLLSAILLVVSPTGFIREAILRRLLLRVSS
jgi:hypothetical protein